MSDFSEPFSLLLVAFAKQERIERRHDVDEGLCSLAHKVQPLMLGGTYETWSTIPPFFSCIVVPCFS